MEDRARGLARHLPHGWHARFAFPAGFWRALTMARGADVLWLLSQHPALVLAARLSGKPFVVDTGDLIAESLRTEGRGAAAVAVGGWLERFSVRAADAVVVRGSAHVPIVLGWRARKVVLIPDGVEVDTFARREPRDTRSQLKVGEAVTVGVIATISVDAGSRLPSPGWDVVETVARLRDVNLVGVIVGDGPGLLPLQRLAQRLGVADRMRWVGRVPPDQLPRWMAAIDIFLHTALNNPMSAVRTTGKLPLLLAAGSAAVVSKVGEASRVLEGTGMLLDFDSTPEDYAARLAERVRDIVARGELMKWREAGPAIARREFDYQVLGGRAAALLSAIAVRGAA